MLWCLSSPLLSKKKRCGYINTVTEEVIVSQWKGVKQVQKKTFLGIVAQAF